MLIARCPEHGLHGQRETCFECGAPVEQVAMVAAAITDEMVERGAEAAFFQDDLGGHIAGRWTWATIPDDGRENYRRMVRAVLAASLLTGSSSPGGSGG